MSSWGVTFISNFKPVMKGYFINNLFILLFLFNILGLFLYIISITTHISVTLFISFIIILFCISNSLYIKGTDFFADFTPENSPLWLAPLLSLIETVSYLARIISLGVRLSANILAGYILISIILNFLFISLKFKYIWFIPLILLGIIINIIIILELLVAIIQSYIFCLLICIYFEETFQNRYKLVSKRYMIELMPLIIIKMVVIYLKIEKK